MKTRISVIIPIYNIEEYIKESLESVLAQSINNLELTDDYERNLQVILVDDGSTDGSSEIAKYYTKNYDNFEYYYLPESKGPGYARNYALKYVEGDFIIFLDSDDIVRPYTYERMYKLALKNQTEMVIGAVWRFNSKYYWESYIHSIAFSGTKEITHITQSPELLYDTTVWNKLIKTSFWRKYDFKFPEDMLYEDIPLNFFLHYYANNVSIIYENCYLWRVRETTNSITQNIDKTKNLYDRFTAMTMIDDFFKEHISDSNLIDAKNIKWLDVDLKIFLGNVNSLSFEEAEIISNSIRDYINENIGTKYIKKLNEIDKLIYEYLLDNNLEKLIEILNFKYFDLKFKNVYLKDSHPVINVDEEIFKTSNLPLDNFVKKADNRFKYIQDVSFKKKNLIVKGFTIIPGIKDEKFDDRDYSFYLVNSESHKKMLLKFKNMNIEKFSTFDIPYGNKIPYNASGYEVKIPFSKIVNNNDFFGENRIQVTFKQKDINFNYFAGPALWNVRRSSKLKARLYKNHYLYVDYDLNNDLLFNITPIEDVYENISINNNQLCIPSENYNGELFLCYDETLIENERIIPLEYDSEKKVYSIDVDKIDFTEGQIRTAKGQPIVHKRKQQIYLHSQRGHVIINTLRDYYLKIKKISNFTLVTDIEENNNNINISAELYSNSKNINSAVLYYKDEKHYEFFNIANGDIIDNKLKFNFTFADKKITKNLHDGTFDLYVKFDDGNNIVTTPVYLENAFNYVFTDKLYDYKLYRSGKSTLKIRSLQKWLESENTEIKRNEIAKTKYELFRKLPINPKRILFDSMWGRQFSCNPRYLYEYINKNHPDYECIWSLEDEQEFITGDAKRVRKYSLKYYYYLATSKFLFDNVNFEDEFVKREGQIYIQTMHGTPLKTFGLDVPNELKTNKSQKLFIERCNRWDGIIVQSDYASKLTDRCFKYDGNLLKFGYPRTDILYSGNNKINIDKLKVKLNIPLDKKVILYAPTWRFRNAFEMMLDLKSLKESLSEEYVIILRMHYFSGKNVEELGEDKFIYDFSDYNSIEELYLISDILITDYSSAMFDYAILDRPIILFTYDMRNYVENIRGIYFDLEEFNPGPVLYTSKEVEDAIINIDKIEEEYSKDRIKFQEKFNNYERENSSELIFNNVIQSQQSKSVLDKFKNMYSKIGFWFVKIFKK